MDGNEMVKRAVAMQANLGKEDGQHILKHRDEIPAAFRGKVIFIFPDWRPSSGQAATYLDWDWDDDQWVWYWSRLDSGWGGDGRLLRRK